MLTTDNINYSSNYRKVKNDDKKYVRSIVIGLSYNKDKLCKVFRNKFSEEEMKLINLSRYLKIDFKNNIIYPKQIERIRGSDDSLQNAMIDKLWQIGSCEDIANDIKVQICVYDHDNKQISCTKMNYKYKINILKQNDNLYVISKKVDPKIVLGCTEAEEDIRAGNKNMTTEERYKLAFPATNEEELQKLFINHYKLIIAY